MGRSQHPGNRLRPAARAQAAERIAKPSAYSENHRRCNPLARVARSIAHGEDQKMSAVMMPITLVTAGAAAIINVWLAVRVGQARSSEKVSIGDGGNLRLIARMRAQANFVEYAPFVLILLGLVEYNAGSSIWLWIAAAAFLLARIAHPLGMDGMRYGRSVGFTVTFVVMLGLAITAITLPFVASHAKTPVVEALPLKG
jgi:uncharacterized membrane protein YecN with MAPEG domain